MHRGRALVLILCALLAACTMRSAVNALTSEEDRAFAQEMVERLRAGDSAWLERQFHPDLWAQSGKQIGQARELYPNEPGTTEIVGFNVSSTTINGRTERSREFTLVSHGGGRWTTTWFRTHAGGGADQVVEWRVTPSSAPPPELTMIETWDSMVPWIWAGVLIVLVGVAALVIWLVRRSRRQSDPLMGQRGP